MCGDFWSSNETKTNNWSPLLYIFTRKILFENLCNNPTSKSMVNTQFRIQRRSVYTEFRLMNITVWEKAVPMVIKWSTRNLKCVAVPHIKMLVCSSIPKWPRIEKIVLPALQRIRPSGQWFETKLLGNLIQNMPKLRSEDPILLYRTLTI